MKKLKTYIGDKEKEAILDNEIITIDEDQIRIIDRSNLGITIELNGEEYRIDDIIDLPDEGLKRIEIRGYTIDVKVVDPVSEALSLGAGGSGEIISPMSGTISSVNIEVGEEVDEGQVILVISAMKMENQITTPIAGVVQNIKVNNNEQVPSGKLLATVVPKE